MNNSAIQSSQHCIYRVFQRRLSVPDETLRIDFSRPLLSTMMTPMTISPHGSPLVFVLINSAEFEVNIVYGRIVAIDQPVPLVITNNRLSN